MTTHEKRIKRKKSTAECFTPSWLIDEMLDKLTEYGQEVWEEDKTFCDPACGNGNMLVQVLTKKLQLGHDPLKALKTIYGTDIMQDNIWECQMRLLSVVAFFGYKVDVNMLIAVRQNIKWTPVGKKHPGGALDYDFEFYKSRKRDALNAPWAIPFMCFIDSVWNEEDKKKREEKEKLLEKAVESRCSFFDIFDINRDE